jgi:hypothetical protein
MGKWSAAQHRNFRKAMAAKKAAAAGKVQTTGTVPRPSKFDFPLDAVPARPARKVGKSPVLAVPYGDLGSVSLELRLQLALEYTKLLNRLLGA